VASICARLEGLPLAIELAAAWVRALGVEQILERLDDAFRLLVGGNRTAPRRQQTMRATLDWSHGLLSEPECVIFQRLAVFAGGWSLEAAEAVCARGEVEPRDVLPMLAQLVDRSLVQVEERAGRARYRLLEPVRQYAREWLVSSGELDALRRQHAVYYEAFAAQAGARCQCRRGRPPGGSRRARAGAGKSADRLALVRGARRSTDGTATRPSALEPLGHAGLYTEGRGWLTLLAALPAAEAEQAMRAVALSINASLAWRQGSYTTALEIYSEALPLLRQANDPWLLHNALADLACIALQQTDYQAAQAYFDEALAVARTAGDRVNEAIELSNLGWLPSLEEDHTTAIAQCEAGLALARNEARSVLLESMHLHAEVGDRAGVAESVESIAALASAMNEPIRAVQLAGAAGGIRESIGAPLSAVGRTALDHWLVPLRQVLGAEVTARAWEAGRAWPLERVEELALAATQPPATPAAPVPGHARGALELSPREHEVAVLLAQELTNRQIAERLVITERTVAAHIEHILGKLGFASRHQMGVWATEHGLLD